MAKKEPTESITCSFCGRPENLVDKLIAGSHAHICDKCIELCVDIVKKKPVAKEFKLLKPKEIKAHLDEYVIGQDSAKKNGGRCSIQPL